MDKKSVSSEQSQPRPFFKRRSVKILAVLLLLAVVIRFSLPIGMKFYLEKWLVEHGADSATIEKVRFGPFLGDAALEGVTVEKDGNTVFSNSNIFVDIGLKNLLDRTALVQQATIEDVVVDIEQSENGGFRIGSYTLPAGKKEPAEKPAAKEDAEESGSWVFFANVVDIENVSVHYRQPTLDVELVIEEARIENFNTDPDNLDGSFMLKGTVNGAPVAVNLEKFIFIPYLDLKGAVKVTDFHLGELAPLLQNALNSFSGVAGLDGQVLFKMEDSENLDVAYDGSLKLADGDVGGGKWAVGGTVSWDGKAAFSMKPGEMVVDTDGDLQALEALFDMPEPFVDIDNSDILIAGKTVVTIGEEVVVDTSASLTLAPTTYLANGFQAGAGDTSWVGKVFVGTGTEKKGLAVRAEGEFSVVEPVFDMDMESGQMEVGNGSLSWSGMVEYIKGVDEGGDVVRTDGTLQGGDTFFRLPDTLDFAQHKLLLQGKTEVKIGEGLAVHYGGDFNLEQTKIDVGGIAIGDESVGWVGDVGYQLAETSQAINLDGQLESSDLTLDMVESGIQVVQQKLNVVPALQLKLADTPSFDGKIGLGAEGLQVNRKSAPMVSLAGISMSGVGGDGSGGILGEAIQLEKFKLFSSESIPVSVDVQAVSLSDIRSADLMSGGVGKITVEKPVVWDAEQKKLLAGLSSIGMENVAVDKKLSASVDRIVLDEGKFMADEGRDAMASMRQLSIEKIEYAPESGLFCDAVTLDSIYADILREKMEPKAEEQVEAAEAAADDKEPTGPLTFPVKIGRIDVVGESSVKFSDASLARTFMTIYNLDSLQVRDIDLTKPEQPFTYSLEGSFDKYTPLKITGECAPLAENLFISQELLLHNLSMLQLSPYTVEAIGTYFPTGMMDLTSSLKIGDGLIDMDNNLIIRDVAAEKVHGELASELDNQLPVPFNLALTMLKDSDGKIDLDVPIDGKLSDIGIGMSDLIWTPVSKAITVAVTPYLAYTALGPAGALTYFGTKFGKELLATHFPVLEFEPGQKDLSTEQIERLEKAGKIMKGELAKSSGKGDGAVYLICARVSISELSGVSANREENQQVLKNEKIRRELFALGEYRSLAVKKYLMSTFDIPDDRLEICNPGLNFDTSAKPVVEFRQ